MKQSWIRRLDRVAKAIKPKPRVHFLWVDPGGPTFQEQRDAMIAAGTARSSDEFVKFCWNAPQVGPDRTSESTPP
jgi:hypothetical protein